MKKTLAVLLSLLLLTSLVFANGSSETTSSAPVENKVAVNATGFPIVNEPLTLTVFGIRDSNQTNWEDMLVFQEYEKMTGIHMDFQETPDQGKDEKKSLLFASNELPDVFYRVLLTENEITRYGIESKQLMPLNDLIDQYAPNLKALLDENPILKKTITSADGNIYALPQIDISNTGMTGFKNWINREWLEALNLEAPTTTDELLDVLRAFKTQDPNGNGQADEIPLGIRESSSVYELGGSWGLEHQMRECINIKDGKVHFWLKDQNFKEYLQFLNLCYSEGLLWRDYYKRDLPAWRANLANAKFGVFYMPYSDVFLNVEDQMMGFAPVVGPHGDQLWSAVNSGITIGTFALSNTCKNPEAAIRWVDYFYSDEGSLFLRYGIEGQTYFINENGNPTFFDEILNNEKGFMTALGEINVVPGGLNPGIITSQTDGVVASDLTKEVAAVLIPYIPETIYEKPSFTTEENERINAIVQDLNKYRDESVTKFIIGEWSFDKWDEYCKTLDKIGLPELEEIYQTAFDRI